MGTVDIQTQAPWNEAGTLRNGLGASERLFKWERGLKVVFTFGEEALVGNPF